jgi:hypothetical protein
MTTNGATWLKKDQGANRAEEHSFPARIRGVETHKQTDSVRVSKNPYLCASLLGGGWTEQKRERALNTPSD